MTHKGRQQILRDFWALCRQILLKFDPLPFQIADVLNGWSLKPFIQEFWLEKPDHSVLERIWIKGSYLSQWLPQGERGPPKESKSRWIEILHGGSQFT